MIQFPFTQITMTCEFCRGALSRWKEEETMPNCWYIKEFSSTVYFLVPILPKEYGAQKPLIKIIPALRNSTIAPLHFYKKLSHSTCLVCTSPFEDHNKVEDSLICLSVCTFHTFSLLFHYCIIDDSPHHLELVVKLTDGTFESANIVNHVSFSLS